jgi:hypothetical protein
MTLFRIQIQDENDIDEVSVAEHKKALEIELNGASGKDDVGIFFFGSGFS